MQEVQFINLKTEDKRNPIGLDEQNPVLSWNIHTTENNWEQEAFQILVGTTEKSVATEESVTTEKSVTTKENITKTPLLSMGEKPVWDSGKIVGGQMSVPYGGESLVANTRYFWRVRVWQRGNGKPSAYSEVQSWHMGLLTVADWQGLWLGCTQDMMGSPLYRHDFTPRKKIKHAFAYVCGLGHYEFYLNGEKVSDYLLQPGWTDYRKTCFYNAYEITGLLTAERENTVGIMLGNGMYHVVAGEAGRYVYYPRSFGHMKFIFQAEIQYEDGTKERVVSNSDWQTAPGPITYSAMYGGEDYDARREMANWCQPAMRESNLPMTTADEENQSERCKSSQWTAAVAVAAPEGTLRAQKNPPVKVMQTLLPVSVRDTAKDTLLFDFGQNFSGIVKIKVKGRAGQTMVLTPGELLAEGDKPDQTVSGGDYYWKYTLKGEGAEIFSPRFTYYGFRYVEIRGMDGLPEIISLEGLYLYPELEAAGSFSCSNRLFNRIHQIITQAMLSNMKSVLTDCPHREKFGWLEQTHLIGPALLANFDLRNLYTKIMDDIRDAQHEDGLIPDIAPEYAIFGYHTGFIDSPEWGSAGVINPWYLYQKYGDLTLLSRYYEVMEKYVSYLGTKTHHQVLHHGLGDWCDLGVRPPYTQNTPVPIVATAVYYMDLDIMRQTAALLSKPAAEADYAAKMAAVKEEFNRQFYDDQTGHYGTGSQTAQAMVLMAGLVEPAQTDRVAAELVANIRANDNGTTAGDVGHPFVLAALKKYGYSDIINDMMNVTDRPGYGYQVTHGATTLTEEWDGPDPRHPHGSQNHFMLGSGDEWFYSGLAGIGDIRAGMAGRNETVATIVIKPYFAAGVRWVKAWQQYPGGKVSVEWECAEEGEVKMNVTIPPNMRARVEVAALDESERVRELGSGSYGLEFKV